MTSKLYRLENKAAALIISLLLIASIIAFSAIEKHLNQSVTQRAFFELEAIAAEQAVLINAELERQLDPLLLVAELLESKEALDSKDKEIINSMMHNNKWCAVGFSDLSGHAVSYDGSELGNVKEREYFSRIASEECDYIIEYLNKTYLTSEPRFIISVPVKKDKELKGVLFASKEASILEPILLGNANKDADMNIFLISSDGTILSSNNSAKEKINSSNFMQGCSDANYSNGYSKDQLTETLYAGRAGSYQYINSNGEKEDVFFMPLGVNDWFLFSTIDESIAEKKYETNLIILKKLIQTITISFYILLLFITMIYLAHIRYIRKKEEELRFEKNRSDIMLSEMGCELVVYDIKSEKVSTDGVLHEKHQFDFSDTLSDLVEKQKVIHPECDFERIKEAIERVVQTEKSTEVIFPLAENTKIHWIKLLLMPYFSENMVVSHIFGAFINITKEHESFEKSAELLSALPGGIRRIKLNEPSKVEYTSEGLTKMLGYDSIEFSKLLEEGNYIDLICEEDRDKYINFMSSLAQDPKICSCEYYMICHDGELMPVSDTTESIKAANGNMYGYSVIMDISSFKEKDKRKDEEIQNAKEQIIEKQIIEKTLQDDQKKLIAATRNVYSEIVSVNLTQNSYYIMNFEEKGVEHEGTYDDYILGKAKHIIDRRQRILFEDRFERKMLLKDFAKNRNVVKLRTRQILDSGETNWIDTKIIFLKPDESGDVTAVILTKNSEEEQRWIENILEMQSKEKVYHDAIIANSAGYMEINVSTGALVNYSLASATDIRNVELLKESINGLDYDRFEKWWADSMSISKKDEFLKSCNSGYLMSQYLKGFRYDEHKCKSVLPTGEEIFWRKSFYLTENRTSGDVIAFCVIYDISEQEKRKREIKELSNELKESRIKNSISQMQPHFLYNTLASIREIILEEPQYASDLICDFTTHLRACIRLLSNNDIVPFSKELENIYAYVNIEKMRFGSKLKVNYEIECDDFYIVPLGIQPLVENAIRHGIYKKGSRGGTVTISTYKDDNANYVAVEDDGVGFAYKEEENGKGEKDSTGLKNLTFRLEKMLNASTSIKSSVESGTKVIVKIPFLREGEENEGYNS